MKTIEDIIRTHATAPLLKEIESLYEIAVAEKWESIQTIGDAFREISDRAESCKGWKEFRTPTRRIHIALGEYTEMTQSEIKETWSSAGNPWAFRLNGKYYQWA